MISDIESASPHIRPETGGGRRRTVVPAPRTDPSFGGRGIRR